MIRHRAADRLDWMYQSGMTARMEADKRNEDAMLGQAPIEPEVFPLAFRGLALKMRKHAADYRAPRIGFDGRHSRALALRRSERVET